MDVKEQLMREKAVLLAEIADSAQRGASQEILMAGERLGRIDSLIERYDKLLRDVSDLGSRNGPTQPSRGSSRATKSLMATQNPPLVATSKSPTKRT